MGQIASKLYEYPDGSREDFLSKCKSGAFDGIHALYRSNDSNKLTGNFNAELLEALPKSLRFICHNGAGYDNIDIDACTMRGIAVSSTTDDDHSIFFESKVPEREDTDMKNGNHSMTAFPCSEL